jgi:hypothetical protein
MAPTALLSLPNEVAQRIFALLPADDRAICACVCRGWRALLADASLWTRLDLSAASGVICRVSDAALRGAAARAGGALEALNLHGAGYDQISNAALLEVVAANARTLRELRVTGRCTPFDALAALLRSGTALHTLCAAVTDCGPEQAPALLRNEPPYGPLRLHSLSVCPQDGASLTEAPVLDVAAALPAHASLRSLQIMRAWLQSDAACGALVDAARAARLPSLQLQRCMLSPAFAFALARLLDGGALTELVLQHCSGLLDEPAAAATLAFALGESTTLTSLELRRMNLWWGDLPGAVLLGALADHPSLQTLRCGDNPAHHGPESVAAAGAAFGVLVAANAPALIALDISESLFGGAAFAPLVDALPRNTHLRRLNIASNNIDEAFASQRLLPAVRANASLRELRADALQVQQQQGAYCVWQPSSLANAVRLVGARAAAADA